MARDPEITQAPGPMVESAEIGKPNVAETGYDDPYSGAQYDEPIDKAYWIACLSDAERAEETWRKRARDIIQIYRNEGKSQRTGKSLTGDVIFNILYANTEVMTGAVYQKPPKPVVRSRFTSAAEPPPPMMPPMMPPMGMPGLDVTGMPGPGGPPGITPPGPALPPVAPGALAAPAAMPPPGAMGPTPIPPGGAPPIDLGAPPPPPMPPEPGVLDPLSMMGAMPGAGMPPPALDQATPQDAIETAASVMEKVLSIVLDNDNSDEAIKLAIKDVLLPGRGVCRVRWKPQMQTVELPGGPLPDGTAPTEDRKIWEEVLDEYVYWEDFLCDPVRSSSDTDWIAFRHLFTKEQMDREFQGSPEYEKIVAAGKVADLLKWTDESAAKSPVGGGSAMKTAQSLGDHVRKCMVWEIWHRVTNRIIWFVREASGVVLRADPDSMQLQGFYPIPQPMLAVTTSDSRIPRPYYDLYAKLAEDLNETSVRISRMTTQIKVRGAYNAANSEVADLLNAGDGKMIPVDGVDLMSGGLQNHIWMVPVNDWMTALRELHLARDQIKNAIYEVMGISDIMRGATKASETATAQRIKGSMGVSRLEDQKAAAANFVRDLLRLKAEIIATNFDAETLAKMTGEDVTPEVMDILRSDFMRTCTIDIETDSTVVPDLQAEQEGMAMIMQSVQLVMQGVQGLLMTQILPPPQVMQLGLELLKMALHPVRYSRGVVELIDTFQKQLQVMPATPPPMGPPGLPPPGMGPPPGLPPGGPPPGGPSPMPPPGANGARPIPMAA
jgi:hypothetical protein